MKFPYGTSHFGTLRREGFFYVDKTPYIRMLEDLDARYLIFLRPRRFGKTTLLSMLGHYYDIAHTEQFDEYFGGLWIHEHPTREKNRYIVLHLDFSAVDSEGTIDEIKRSFKLQMKASLRRLIARHVSRVPKLRQFEEMIETYDDAPADVLSTLISILDAADERLYVLIDEYDHFGNRLLSDGRQADYEAIVRGTGFVRTFYTALKSGTTSGTLARMLVTGVSPIMLDDLSSGFNIISHISQDEKFNGMAGFTPADVERTVDELLRSKPELANEPRIGNREVLLDVMQRYYDGYRFSKWAAERMYNSTLVLYFLGKLYAMGRYPDEMLDLNMRTDYGRLQRIAVQAGGGAGENRQLLEAILVDGAIGSTLVEQFGSRTPFGQAQLVSLFYYMGMLTFGPNAANEAIPSLVIPNLVIRELQWEYLALAMQDYEGISVDMTFVARALSEMAVRGDIEPLLTLFRERVIHQLGNKDLRQFNEKTLKLMLLAYISQVHFFSILSEKEFARGYCDLFLSVSEDVPSGRYSWMLEVKYLKTNATKAEIDKVVAKAYEQLERYASDGEFMKQLTREKEYKAGALIFVGAKDVVYRPWPPKAPAGKKAAKKKTGHRERD